MFLRYEYLFSSKVGFEPFVQVIIKSMGWNLVGPLIKCIHEYKEDDIERDRCKKILDKLVEVSYNICFVKYQVCSDKMSLSFAL